MTVEMPTTRNTKTRIVDAIRAVLAAVDRPAIGKSIETPLVPSLYNILSVCRQASKSVETIGVRA